MSYFIGKKRGLPYSFDGSRTDNPVNFKAQPPKEASGQDSRNNVGNKMNT